MVNMKFALVALVFLAGSMLHVASAGGPIEELMSAGVGGGYQTGQDSSSKGSSSSGEKSQDKTTYLPALIGGALLGGGGGGGGAGGKDEGFLGIKGPVELLKLIVNPIEFCKRVAEHYKLHFGKFIHLLQKGSTFNLELALQPALLTFKIIEKIFVPDVCKLKLICKCAHQLSFAHEQWPKFSSKFLAGSHIIKAASDGLQGNDCEVVYSGCTKGAKPKLKKEYEAAGHQHNGSSSGSHEHQANSHEHQGNSHEQQGNSHEQGGEQYESRNVFKTLKSVG